VLASVLLAVAATSIGAAGPSGGAEGRGYWVATAAGQVVPFGEIASPGDLSPGGVPGRVVAIEATPGQAGAWLTDTNGVVYTVGDAPFLGDPAAERVTDVAAFAATRAADGYWIATRTARVFAYGTSANLPGPGSAGMTLNQPIVGMTTPPGGDLGIWLVATDGGVFSYGSAVFHGSTGAIRLNKPIVGMAATVSGQGYWLVASDGGVFAFGDAAFFGSAATTPLAAPAVAVAGLAGA
jgi:hypothetical protein